MLSKLKKIITSIKEKFSLLLERFKNFLKKIILPGFEGQNLYKVSKFFKQAIVNGNLGSRAASVTFYFLLALFPLVICIFSLIPYIPIENFQESILASIESFFPREVYSFFDDALKDLITRKRGFLLSIGFITTLYFASSGINALLQSFSESKHITKKRKIITSSAWSIALLFIFILLSALVTVMAGLGQWGIDLLLKYDFIGDNLVYWFLVFLKFIITLLLYYALISIVFNVGNTEREKWKFFSVGATAATLLILIFQKFFSIYLTDIAKLDSLYGPLGACIGFLLFFYYLFYVIIVAFELNTSIHKAKREV